MKGRAARLGAALAGLLLAGGAAWLWLARAPRDAKTAVGGLWSARGVAKPNVVIVTLDTTRADHLGCYGYAGARTPNLDAIARDGVLFTQAATTAPLTQPAHSSIMTGSYPTYHGVRVNGTNALGQAHTTIAEALAAKGYATGAFLGAFVLDGRWGLNQGFQLYDDRFDLKEYKHLDLGTVQRPGNVVVDAALAWTEAHKQEAFLAWIHLYDAHTPYEPPEPFLSEYRARGPAGLYDGEIAFLDTQIGRILSWLRTSGLAERSVVVVVGDHGEALGSHGEGTHGYFVYDYAVHVPLLVATPFAELRGVRVESQVSIVDVFPTVLALAGIDAAPVHGRSLVPEMFDPRLGATRYAYSESMTPNLQFGWSPLHSLRSGRYKLIKAPRPELYDLVADPQEATNLAARRPAEVDELMAELNALIERTSRGAPKPETADLDKDTAERLAALGYVGAPAAPKTADPARPLADPKDKLAAFSAVQRAGELIVSDEYEAAVQALESAVRDEPTMTQALLMLGTSYSELGRTRQAKAQFDRVLKDDPQNVQALVGMASLLMEENRDADVVALCTRTLSLDEQNTQAHTLLGEVYAAQRKPGEALAHFEKAVAIQPKLTQNRLNLAGSLIELKQFGRAEAMLKEIVAEFPRFPLAQFNLGLLYDEQGRREDARAAYAAEVEAYPHQFRARFNLGKLLFQLGQRDAALAQMREVMRIAPERPEGHLFVARGLLLQEPAPIEEVQALVENGLSVAKSPDMKSLGWLLLADVYNRKKQPDKMNEALARARALTRSDTARSRDANAH